MSATALQAVDLGKTFGNYVALNNLNLEVKSGEIYCLLGANGAGKTTTVNLFLSFLEPTTGKALIFDTEVAKNPQETRSKVTYLPEQVSLYPELTGLENLNYLLTLSKVSKRDRATLVAALNQAGLDEKAHNKAVSGYSKGMRQKVGIALAIAKRSEVLLLDEPTSGLDPASANEFSQIVVDLAEQGAAVLMVTHDLFRVKQISHRLGIMKSGVLVEQRNTADLELPELEQLYLEHMRK